MEVSIRLQKFGKPTKGHYNYRVVAIPKTKSRDSRNLEILGYYDPAKKVSALSINEEKLNRWLKNGARMSDTVKSLVKSTKKAK